MSILVVGGAPICSIVDVSFQSLPRITKNFDKSQLLDSGQAVGAVLRVARQGCRGEAEGRATAICEEKVLKVNEM